MKKIMTVACVILLSSGVYSCSSTRPTKKADPTKMENKAMRHKNLADQPTLQGHQKAEIEEKTSK